MALPVVALTLKGHRLRVERAESPWAVGRGLMFRRSLAADAGMWLRFRRDADWAIHMWFVRMPLDVLFLAADGAILHVRSVHPGARPFRSGHPVRSVLELNFGWCAEHGVGPGDGVDLPGA